MIRGPVLWLVALLLCPVAAWSGDRAVVDWEYGYVNVRPAPSTGSDPVGRLTRGAETEVLGAQGDWLKIRYPGGEGSVVARSLRRLPAEVPSPDPGRAPGPAPPAAPVPQPGPTPAVARPAPPSAAAGEPGPGPAPVAEARPPGAGATPDGGTRPAASPDKGYLSEYLDKAAPPVADPGGGLLQLFSGLLVVLALIAGGVWVFRRLLGRRFPVDSRARGIRVLASRPVGPRQALLLVEVGGLVWLLSQGGDGVSLVAEIRDPDALRRLDERYEFLESAFEAEFKKRLDLESAGADAGEGGPSTEERLAALRRRPRSDGES